MRAKLAALGHYEQLGDASAVCRIREELSDVEEAIRQLDAKSRVRAPVALDAVS
jgi:hypothetical protein